MDRKEKQKISKQKSYEKNKEKRKADMLQYYYDNRQELLTRAKDYYYKNREERLQKSKDYYKANKAKIDAQKQERIEKKKRIEQQTSDRAKALLYFNFGS